MLPEGKRDKIPWFLGECPASAGLGNGFIPVLPQGGRNRVYRYSRAGAHPRVASLGICPIHLLQGHPHPPQCAHWGTFPLEGGRLSGRLIAAPTAPFEPFGTGGSGTCAEGGDLPPHPPRIRSAPPPKGKAFGRPQGSPVRRIRKQQHFSRRGRSQTGPPGFVPGALARQTQAQNLNRTECNFGEARPQWAGRKRRPPLKFCAPEIPCLPQGITPVMGVWGKAVIGERSSPLRRPPASFGSFSTGKRNSPRRAKPCKNITV